MATSCPTLARDGLEGMRPTFSQEGRGLARCRPGAQSLDHAGCAEAVKRCVLRLDGDRLLVLAALFVPAHDHLHLEPLKGHELSKVLRGIEGVGSGEPAAGRSLDLLAWRTLQERCLRRKPVSPYCRYTAAHLVNAGLKEEEYCIHLGGSEVSVCTI